MRRLVKCSECVRQVYSRSFLVTLNAKEINKPTQEAKAVRMSLFVPCIKQILTFRDYVTKNMMSYIFQQIAQHILLVHIQGKLINCASAISCNHLHGAPICTVVLCISILF